MCASEVWGFGHALGSFSIAHTQSTPCLVLMELSSRSIPRQQQPQGLQPHRSMPSYSAPTHMPLLHEVLVSLQPLLHGGHPGPGAPPQPGLHARWCRQRGYQG